MLFDLDGTLTDPKVGIICCIEHALTTLNVPLPNDLTWCIGPPLQDCLRDLLGDHPQADPVEALRLYRERYVEVGMFENRVIPGIDEVLTRLSSLNHFNLLVATSKPQVYSQQILTHFKLQHHFSAVYGSELDGTRTRKSDLIRHILEHESLEKNHSIMIGDRKHDIQGARRAGIAGIGVLWGYGDREELTEAGTKVLVESPSQLMEHVESTYGPA